MVNCSYDLQVSSGVLNDMCMVAEKGHPLSSPARITTRENFVSCTHSRHVQHKSPNFLGKSAQGQRSMNLYPHSNIIIVYFVLVIH